MGDAFAGKIKFRADYEGAILVFSGANVAIMFKFSAVLTMSLLIVITLFAQPPFPSVDYTNEMWRGDDPSSVDFAEDTIPHTGFLYLTKPRQSEPGFGYPMHSGIVDGVSDTFQVVIRLFNRDSTYVSIDPTVENWWQPAIWDNQTDIRAFPPLTLSSSFGYQFKYWFKTLDHTITSRPTSIGVDSDLRERYELMFYLWGLPAGRYIIQMNKTSYAPTGLQQVIECDRPVWIAKPHSLTDTLNAFAACAWRSEDLADSLSMLRWADSIFARDPTSLVGYVIRRNAYRKMNDTLNVNNCLDSLFYILNRYGDPVLGDSLSLNEYQIRWRDDLKSSLEYYKWEWESGPSKTLWLRM